MKRLLQIFVRWASPVLGLLVCCALPVGAQTQRYQSVCSQGGVKASLTGLLSTNQMVSAFPSCTVTVYLHGSSTLATLYQDRNNTPLSNPFLAGTNSLYGFYVAPGNYDITMSAQGMTTTSTSDISIINPNPTVVQASAFAGNNLGQQVCAADASLGSAVGTISVDYPATITTPCTLSVGHSLRINAPVSLQTASSLGSTPLIVLNGDNEISCSGPGALLSVGSNVAYPFGMASGAANVSLHDCAFTAPANNGYILVSFVGSVSHISMSRVVGTNIGAFWSSSGLDDLRVNGSHFTAPTGCAPAAFVYVTGSGGNIDVVGNTFTGGCSAFTGFALDAASNLSYATIVSTGIHDINFSGNVCTGTQAQTCAWGSDLWRAHFVGNSARGVNDITFDFEGSADSDITGNNILLEGGNGAGAICYSTGYNNSFVDNQVTSAIDTSTVEIKNNSGQAGYCLGGLVSHNKVTYVGLIGAFLHLESSDGLVVKDNEVTNGRLDPIGATENGVFDHNYFRSTLNVNVNGHNAGVVVPGVYHANMQFTNNTVESLEFTQDAAAFCIYVGEGDPTGGNSFQISGNFCPGQWTKGIGVSSPNGGDIFTVRNNLVPLPVNIVTPGDTVNFSNNCSYAGLCDQSQVGTSFWTSGTATPSGTCVTGNLYTKTSGTTNALYVCQNAAWVAK